MDNKNIFPEGSLAVIATPLGNLGDITRRAVEMLMAADIVAAEDTRTTRRLFTLLGIDKPLISYHDWNEAKRAEELVRRLGEGQRVALVSDAGTPGISDPGFDAVRLARREGYRVIPVPGASALTTFLSVSGLATNAFTFLGFLPNKEGKRKKALKEVATKEETLVFYESPHRILATLADALEILGDREAALGREMTKSYEEFLFGPISEIIKTLAAKEKIKGEICWGVTGYSSKAAVLDEDSLEEELKRHVAEGTPLKAAAKELATRYNLPSKELYARLNALKNQEA